VRRLGVALDGIEQDAHGAVAVEIGFSDFTDVACISHKHYDGALEFGGHRAWGQIAYRRMTGDGAVALGFEHTVVDGVCGR
jgi:hypothetical protein